MPLHTTRVVGSWKAAKAYIDIYSVFMKVSGVTPTLKGFISWVGTWAELSID